MSAATGSSGAFKLTGGTGQDSLTGGAGADIISGGGADASESLQSQERHLLDFLASNLFTKPVQSFRLFAKFFGLIPESKTQLAQQEFFE